MGAGLLLALANIVHGIFWGPVAGKNPWKSAGFEWLADCPPIPENFEHQPVVSPDSDPYHYTLEEVSHATEAGALVNVKVAHHFESLEKQSHANRLGVWMFLGSESLLFAPLFVAYCGLPRAELRRLRLREPDLEPHPRAPSTPFCSSPAASPWPARPGPSRRTRRA